MTGRFTTLFLLLSSLTILAQSPEDILFTVGDDPVTVSEFRYIYEKNNAEEADYSRESLDEYLELYKNFKLKVTAAKDKGYHERKSFKQELNGYRKELAKNYLMDKGVVHNLALETYERMKTDLNVSHIFLKGNSTIIGKKADALYEELMDGGDFDKLASTRSQDKGSKSKKGNLGFISAPYPEGFYKFENAAYQLQVGEISKPVKSKSGYHIIRLVDKRPGRGEVDISQILLRVSKEDSRQKGIIAENKINKIYGRLKKGDEFEILARDDSEDKNTNFKGGHLGTFGAGVFSKEFEENMFSLSEPGDYTIPFQTNLGWHILKLNRLINPNEQSFTELKDQIVTRLRNSPRLELAEQAMVEKVKESSNYELQEDVFSGFTNSLDSSFFDFRWKPKSSEEALTLMTFEKTKYNKNLSDFQKWLKRNARDRLALKYRNTPAEAAEILLEDFASKSIYEYQNATLEEHNPEFKNLMREYEEGILLFEFTKDEVWDKANSDTSGIKKYFEKNREDYKWGKRSFKKSYTINSTNANTVSEISADIRKGVQDEKLLEKHGTSKDYIKIEKKHAPYEDGDKPGKVVKTQFDKQNHQSVIIKIEEVREAELKTLDESRGFVISDYQSELEKEWLQSLRKQYEVNVNKKILRKLASN